MLGVLLEVTLVQTANCYYSSWLKRLPDVKGGGTSPLLWEVRIDFS